MGWEKRRNNYYYYRKKWENGHCISKYEGAGELAVLFEQTDKIRRMERIIGSGGESGNSEKFAEIDEDLGELERMTKKLVENFLINKGFYKTSSREWRLRKYGIYR